MEAYLSYQMCCCMEQMTTLHHMAILQMSHWCSMPKRMSHLASQHHCQPLNSKHNSEQSVKPQYRAIHACKRLNRTLAYMAIPATVHLSLTCRCLPNKSLNLICVTSLNGITVPRQVMVAPAVMKRMRTVSRNEARNTTIVRRRMSCTKP